ncbi:MAG TPA: hypothetical protein VGJ18_11245 [Gemmatimonadaceae bacterium]|jgi:hypothetical protein
MHLCSAVILFVSTACRGPAPGVIGSVVADTGSRSASRGRLAFPMILDSTCEGEDCETTFAALACDDVVLQAAPSTTAAIVARIKRGDTLNVRRTDLHVLRPGIVVLKRNYVLDSSTDEEGSRSPRPDTLHFAAGDTVYLVQYLGLGSWEWWHRGRTSSGGEFWAGPVNAHRGGVARSKDSTIAVGRSHPVSQAWWLIQRRTGQVGWWAADSARAVRSIQGMKHWDDWCVSPSSTPPS